VSDPGDDAEIVVVDRDDRHVYQPGLLFVPFRLADADGIVRSRSAQLHDGIEFRLGEVDRVETAEDRVLLTDGTTLPYDVLVIASMIEREAQVPRDRRLISAVIYNRLQKGMPLGIDATLRYRLNNWSKALRESELNIDSDYNTRRRIGLPPTPIGNPGLASIQAAADPASAKYLFYVVKPCGNGAHAFSSTDAQFQKDVAAYNRARDKRGGKDPSHC